jgi:hypothetical protein
MDHCELCQDVMPEGQCEACGILICAACMEGHDHD